MSPRAALRSTEKPLPRRRNWSPVCVPGGIFTLRLGAVDRRHLDLAAQRRLRHAQRHAHEDVGAVALEDRMRPDRRHARRDRRAARPGRRPRLRRPAGCACRPPRPAGIATCSVRSRCTVPAPWQIRHGLRITRPWPPQVGQVRSTRKKPCCARTLPAPWQVAQVSRGARLVLGPGAVAGLAGHARRHPQVRPWCRRTPRSGRSRRPGGYRRRRACAAPPPRRPPMKSPNIWSKMSPRPPPRREVEAAGEAARPPPPCSNAAWP